MIGTAMAIVVAHVFVAQPANVSHTHVNVAGIATQSLAHADSASTRVEHAVDRRFSPAGNFSVGVHSRPSARVPVSRPSPLPSHIPLELVPLVSSALSPEQLALHATFSTAETSAASIFDGVPEWMAPVMSAIVPGTGQVRLRQDRFAAFMAIEVYSWVQYTRHRQDGARAKDAYQALAADVARSLFSAARPLGNFEYYETMERFLESGSYNLGGAATLIPESDESTFNGFLWLRARETYWEDPAEVPPVDSDAYARAIRYYEERAVTDEFRWSWRNAQLEHDIFRQTISRSNDSYRRSVRDLGIIIGNHILSMVDAFVAVRLRMRVQPESQEFSVSASVLLNRGRQ